MTATHTPHAVDEAFAAVPRDQWSAGPGSLDLWAALRPGATFPPDRTIKAGTRSAGGSPRDTGAASAAQQRRATAMALLVGPQIYALYVAGRTLKEIGAIVGKDKGTVGDWLRRYCAARGLPMPIRGENTIPV
jgi:hypothetical protein